MLRQVLMFVIQHLVFLMLLATGLRMSFEDIRNAFERRGLLLRTLLVTSLVVPLLAMLVVALVPVSRLAGGIILLFAICPGAPFILMKFKEHAHLPSVLLALVSALAVVTLPIWVVIMDRVFALDFQISPATVLQLSLRTVLLPLLLGIAIHQFAPRAAVPLAKVADILYKVSLLVVLVVVLVKVAPMLLRVQPIGIFAVLLTTVLATLAGHWAGRPALEDRKVVQPPPRPAPAAA
jgi:bile acid:Na+ symporter, BASS family